MRIRVELFPYESFDVDTMLTDLHNCGFIQRYQSGSMRLISIVNFHKHQSPHVKEVASTLPAPDRLGASTGPARLTPDSLLLTPDPPLPTADSGLLTTAALCKTPAGLVPVCKNGNAQAEDFAEFWRHNWRTAGKKPALAAWNKRATSPEITATIMNAVVKARQVYMQRELDKRPHMSTWLNQERYMDEPESEEMQHGLSKGQKSTIAATEIFLGRKAKW